MSRADWRAGLKPGLAALKITLPAASEARLLEFVELLARWNQAYNLTAVREPAEMVVKHLLDSLAVLPYVTCGPVQDVGAGAGLPGIPLAIALPDIRFTLLDSNGKKTRFMTQAVASLKLRNVEVVQARAEGYRPPEP
ncbi:MAG TPA: 16S rRNA (guanine(527)-N(7))-methyltransferase RsmG, partial [Gammaproteobacteria bacterium]|nr:16S rRNA (guanine(527)-N(7))-methyltransferase RsmG [Gammaproteobacteria bacterium]